MGEESLAGREKVKNDKLVLILLHFCCGTYDIVTSSIRKINFFIANPFPFLYNPNITPVIPKHWRFSRLYMENSVL